MKRIAQSCGFAAILLLPNYFDLTSSGGTRMRFPSPLTRIALAQLVDLVIVAVAFGCATWLLRKSKTWPKVRWALMAFLPPFLLVCNLGIFPVEVPHATVVAVSALWIGALVLLIWRVPAFAVKLRHAGNAVLAGFGVFALIVAWQLIHAALWRPGPQAFATPIPAQSASKPRLVWILFDELAYKYTFESSDPSLNLPNFDRLRGESTLYTDVIPIAYHTEQVVPSLMLGRNVTDAKYTSGNRYLVKIDNSPQWTQFDASISLFGMAKRYGVTTSIVGWYIPYCPIFEGVATECYWTDRDVLDRSPDSPNASFAEDVWYPLRILAEQFLVPSQLLGGVTERNAEGHAETARDLSAHALDTLAHSQADIIYLHLPVPHPAAFWSRRTRTYAAGGSYLDSLDYTDRLLGQILDMLQSHPRWAATTLIVQGDHSWRTGIWRTKPGWSAEDERISHGGQWDSRPALLIHAPGQQAPEAVTTPTSLMLVHNVVAAQIQAIAR